MIRDANLFLDKIDRVPFADAGEKDQITGEVYLLRAWNYFALLRLYGGVPIVDRVFGLDEADVILQSTRASFAETVDFIPSDIDKSLPLLGKDADVPSGLLHKSAAKALKSRVLLHGSSDLYNQPGNTNALLLNHAEACIELGQEAEARASLKLVRERAGMPGSDVDNASGTAQRDLY